MSNISPIRDISLVFAGVFCICFLFHHDVPFVVTAIPRQRTRPDASDGTGLDDSALTTAQLESVGRAGQVS